MRHRVKKIKFKGGHDATRMLVRQLLKSFILAGHMTSSPTKIAVLRSRIEVLVHKAKNNSQADRNYIFKSIADKKIVGILFTKIAPVFKDRTGGYVRVIKLSKRGLDNKELARLEWVSPVILEEKKVVATVEKGAAEKKPVAVKPKALETKKSKSTKVKK